MKNIAFTICAKNYIGLAQVLEKSLKFHNPDIEFFIFVADEIADSDQLNSLSENILITKDLIGFSDEKWNQMSFKYDLTEFCTSIKPSCFKYLFQQFQPDTCIYFDPDILVFNQLKSIYTALLDHSIVVTPHITTIEENYSGDLSESGFLYTGMFNLGFLALKRDASSASLLNWWEKRLEDRCFQNRMENYFTDQKWMDFLPSLFPTQLFVSFDLGLNLAPWNFYEREVIVKDGTYFVANRINKDRSEIVPLTFVHFSGFNYSNLIDGKVTQSNILNLNIYADIDRVLDDYRIALKESSFLNYQKLTYTYNHFSDSTVVTRTYRKLFRRLFEDNQIEVLNPFDVNGKYYNMLKVSGVLNEKMSFSDKKSISTVGNVNKKLRIINKSFYYIFKLLGAERFFMLVRLLRLYSKVENHVYLIDDHYLKEVKIRD